MMEAIQVAGIDAATGAAGGAGAAAQPQASAIEVRDFGQAQLRAAGVTQPPQASGAEAVSGAAEAGQSEGTKMLASAFDDLNANATNMQRLASEISSTNGELMPSQMFEMTMQAHKFLFQSQLTSNVANRTSDGVQQLFRQQS